MKLLLVRCFRRCVPVQVEGLCNQGLAPSVGSPDWSRKERSMIRKLASGGYRLYSRKKRTRRRANAANPWHLPDRRAKAEAHERAVQYFKRA
jgi:hypothetical protein